MSLPSTFAAKTFLKAGFDREKLFINPYGVDTLLFSKHHVYPAGVKHVFTNTERLRILYVGSSSYRKGFDLLSAVAQQVQNIAEFVHVGSQVHTFDQRTHDCSHVTSIGSVPQFELPYYYSQADLFLFPSREDGFGMVLLQAASCGLPILSTYTTGAPDSIPVCHHNLCLLPDNMSDSDAIDFFVDRIKLLYNDRTLLMTLTTLLILRSETAYMVWLWHALFNFLNNV